ncbi:hypothetical protein [Halegenticoccus soli]|uniref:hypothetical protein n=1 Tax=Halegenticoccus soli TaxID=1985678 RepID=UPI000C6EEF0C|nr:hypothetical protein [Halegenticoccus soli]
MRLAVPVARAEATFDLSVAYGGDERDYEWHVPEEGVLFFDVGTDEVRPTCDGSRGRADRPRIEAVGNRDDREHRLRVRVDVDGEVAVERAFGLPPRTTRSPDVRLPRSGGRYRVAAELDAGERVTGDWTLCPPPDPLRFSVEPNGTLVLGSGGARIASKASNASEIEPGPSTRTASAESTEASAKAETPAGEPTAGG